MPTHYKGSRRDRAVLDAYIKLMRSSGAVHGRQNTVLREMELTHSQFGVMEALWHLGPLNQRTVGAKLFFTEGNVTYVVSNLEERGYLKRERDPDDRRNSILRLTRAGKEKIERAFAAYMEDLRESFSALSASELEQLDALCRKLGRHAQSL